MWQGSTGGYRLARLMSPKSALKKMSTGSGEDWIAWKAAKASQDVQYGERAVVWSLGLAALCLLL